MRAMTLEEILQACQGQLIGRTEDKAVKITDITTDSRRAEAGSLFIPIKGSRADGHDFIGQVFDKGAAASLSERRLEGVSGPYILVASTLQAIKDIAEYYLKTLSVKVIGVTGSVGKTSTKEMIASVLEQRYKVHKTKGNFNNELGLPLTIFGIEEEHQVAVLEMGISEFGEMHRLSKIARPSVCVVTNIGDCHLESLKTRAGVWKAKAEMFDYMPVDGKILLNGDDQILGSEKNIGGTRPAFFGLNPDFPVYADHIVNRGLLGMRCNIHTEQGNFTADIRLPGPHMVYNALAGTAVGCMFGLTLTEIGDGIAALKPIAGRTNMIETKDFLIVDDCYNANPMSMKSGLEMLSGAAGRKVAILGDMFELGENSSKLHADVGAFGSEKQVDLLICIGDQARFIADGAVLSEAASAVLYLRDKKILLKQLHKIIEKGDTILVKASHGMKFEEVVAALKELSDT